MDFDVVEGRDGYYFLRQGSNEVLRFYIEPDYFTEAMADAWAVRLIERRDHFAARGVRYVHLGVPDKITMMPDKYPEPLPYLHRHPLALVGAAIAARGEADILVDPMADIAHEARRYPMYLRTDTHWTIWAAWIAYRAVCARLGFAPTVDLAGREPLRFKGVLDLGAKLDPPAEEDVVHFPLPDHVERVYANEIVTLVEQAGARGEPAPMHLGSHVVYRNPRAPHDERLFIFGDSYVDYRPSSFTALMAETFAEVHFFWAGHIDRAMVHESGATLVVSEFNERFMRWCPDDVFDGAAYAAERVAEYRAHGAVARHHEQFHAAGRAEAEAGVLAWAHYGTKQALETWRLCVVRDGFVLAGSFGVAVADAERRIVVGPDVPPLAYVPEALEDVFVVFDAKGAALHCE